MRIVAKLMLASTVLTFGLAPLQAEASWSVSNVKGSYAFRFIGLDTVFAKSWIAGTGVFVTDGGGNISSGSITYNDGGNVCQGNITNSTYTVLADGEGTVTLPVTLTSGSCPITNFVFATALANPTKASPAIATTIEMNTTSVDINSEISSAVMIYGVSNFL